MKYMVVAFILISCNNLPKSNKIVAQESALRRPVNDVSSFEVMQYSVIARPEIFEKAFFKGTKEKIDTFALEFYPVNLGKINIESGKVIAGDPIVMKDLKPFMQTFPIGEFPVWLSVAKIGDDERVAFSL